jgi:hypothetical protein
MEGFFQNFDGAFFEPVLTMFPSPTGFGDLGRFYFRFGSPCHYQNTSFQMVPSWNELGIKSRRRPM